MSGGPTTGTGARTALVYGAVSLLICAIVLLPFYAPAGNGLDVTGHPIGRDFINNWAGPQLAFSGRMETLFDLDGYVEAIGALFGHPLPFHNWGYPPFTLIWFWPLAQLPYVWALALWTLLLFAAYAAVGVRLVAPGERRIMLALLLCAPSTLVNTVGGQNGFMTAALMVGGVLALDRRPLLAGLLFGLLTAKPQLGLVLPLALIGLRAWRTIAAACVTTAILIGVSLLVLGPEPWRQYLTQTSAFQLGLLQHLHGFYPYMMTSVLAEARILGATFTPAAALQLAVSVPVAVIAALAVRRTPDPRQRALILASAAPLVTPYAFNYDLTALTLALSWRFLEPRAGETAGASLLLRVAWLLPILIMPLNMLGWGIAPAVLLAVFVLAVREAAGGLPAIQQGAPVAGTGA